MRDIAPPNRSKSASIYNILLILLLICAAISVVQGGNSAFFRSQDFQWSGTKLLLQHIDPWAEYLRDKSHQGFLLTQAPNYLPILYIFLAPLGFLPVLQANIVWFFCNLTFAIAAGTMTARFYGFRGRTLLMIVALLLAATPTRTTFGNGQQGLFVLFLWCISLFSLRLTDARSAIAGTSYFKFNFGPPVFLYLLFRGGIRAVFISAVPSAVATVIVWLWLTGGRDLHALSRLAMEPIKVGQTGYFPSGTDSNLMDVLEFLSLRLHLPVGMINILDMGAAVLLCAVILFAAVRIRRSGSVQWQLALMALMSCSLFRHHFYDSVVYLLPLCYALRLRQHRSAQVVIGVIGYLWYIQRAVDFLWRTHFDMFILQFVLLMIALCALWKLQQAEQSQERSLFPA